MALYFFQTVPPPPDPPPPPPCCCICVCSNFSSLIMALAVANITHIAQQRQQRPLRPCSSPSPLSSAPCFCSSSGCCCWDVTRTHSAVVNSCEHVQQQPFPPPLSGLWQPLTRSLSSFAPPPPAAVDYFMRFLRVFMRILCLYFWRKVFC